MSGKQSGGSSHKFTRRQVLQRGVAATGAAVLAPTIILGYAVKAAERDDRERGF